MRLLNGAVQSYFDRFPWCLRQGKSSDSSKIDQSAGPDCSPGYTAPALGRARSRTRRNNHFGRRGAAARRRIGGDQSAKGVPLRGLLHRQTSAADDDNGEKVVRGLTQGNGAGRCAIYTWSCWVCDRLCTQSRLAACPNMPPFPVKTPSTRGAISIPKPAHYNKFSCKIAHLESSKPYFYGSPGPAICRNGSLQDRRVRERDNSSVTLTRFGVEPVGSTA